MPEQLGKYSTGVNSGPGFITSHLQGKEIECLMMDGLWLIIRTTDGHEARIGWQDISGNQLKGEPFLENLDVKIMLPSVGFGGAAGDV